MGSPFRIRKLLCALARHRLVGSMRQAGSSEGRTATESFFLLLQENIFDRQTWMPREQLPIAMLTWIVRTDHSRRRQRRLDRLTVIEYEHHEHDQRSSVIRSRQSTSDRVRSERAFSDGGGAVRQRPLPLALAPPPLASRRHDETDPARLDAQRGVAYASN